MNEPSFRVLRPVQGFRIPTAHFQSNHDANGAALVNLTPVVKLQGPTLAATAWLFWVAAAWRGPRGDRGPCQLQPL